jgi:peptidoglycan-N-acetylmuramic acid deacetylase PdaC-like protein/uncharacterized protein DUF3298
MRSTLIMVLLIFFVAVNGQAEQKNITAPEFEFEFPEVPQLKSFFQSYENDLRQEMNSEFDRAKAEGDIYNPWSLSAKAEVAYQGKFWAVAVEGYDYRGGAHGMPVLGVYYFDAQTFEQLPQSRLLADGAYESLSRLTREGLVSQGFAADDEWMIEGTKPTADNFQLVIPSEEGVKVIFNSYQVASYSRGTPSVELSWDVADKLFKESYKP